MTQQSYNFEVLHKLVQDLDSAESRDQLGQLIKSHWIDEHWEEATPQDLVDVALVAESGILHSEMQKTAAKIAESGKLDEDTAHAFKRFNTKEPDLHAVHAVIPESPTHFATPFTMWQWHHDFMKANKVDIDLVQVWEAHVKEALRLYKLWSLPEHHEKPSLELKKAQKKHRWLVIVPECKSSEYLSAHEGEFMKSELVASKHRDHEGLRRALTKFFQHNHHHDKLSEFLDQHTPTQEELESFMFSTGADAVVASPETAAVQTAAGNTKTFDVIAFPISAFADPMARTYILLVLAVMRYKKLDTMDSAAGLPFHSNSLPTSPLAIVRRRHVHN